MWSTPRRIFARRRGYWEWRTEAAISRHAAGHSIRFENAPSAVIANGGLSPPLPLSPCKNPPWEHAADLPWSKGTANPEWRSSAGSIGIHSMPQRAGKGCPQKTPVMPSRHSFTNCWPMTTGRLCSVLPLTGHTQLMASASPFLLPEISGQRLPHPS